MSDRDDFRKGLRMPQIQDLWQRFKDQRQASAHATKASQVGPMIALSQVGRAVWTPRNYESLTKEGYVRNVILYRCVSLIARGAASVPWRLYKGNEELTIHPLLTLLHMPSPMQAGSAFIEAALSYLLLAGNSYLEIVKGREGIPAELYALRPDRVLIIPGACGLPQAIRYTVNGRKRDIAFEEAPEKSPLLHLKLFNPLNDWYGMSPVEAAACSIDQHNTVGEHNISLLQNGGRPSGAFIVGKDSNFRTGEDERNELRQQIKDAFQGPKKAGAILFMEGDFEWCELGLSPRDLDFSEGKSVAAREIAQAYGVPPMLVGVPGDATFANYREARFHLWEDTILPLLDYVVDEFNMWLAPQFEKDLRLSYDIDKIPALAPRREEAWAKISKAAFLTLNEKRAALGYAPLPDGDRL